MTSPGYLRSSAVIVVLLLLLVGCGAAITNYRASARYPFLDPKGVPWVEPRLYDVYVYEGTLDGDEEGNLIYHGRHALVDMVNGTPIDSKRRRWETNYFAGPFSDAFLNLKFHTNGGLKEARLTTAFRSQELTRATTAALGVEEEIRRRELERLERGEDFRALRRRLKEE